MKTTSAADRAQAIRESTRAESSPGELARVDQDACVLVDALTSYGVPVTKDAVRAIIVSARLILARLMASEGNVGEGALGEAITAIVEAAALVEATAGQ